MQDLADASNDPEASPSLPPGATANSPLQIPMQAWLQILKRAWLMAGFHELGLLAAGVAFYTFLALSPLIAITVMVYGLVGSVETVQAQMQNIVEVVPGDVAELIESQLMRIVTTSTEATGVALFIALFFALFGGMRAANGMISALNIINEEHETRNVIKRYLRAAALTLAAIVLALTGILSGGIFAWLQVQTSDLIGESTSLLFKILAWVAAILLGSTGFAVIMRYGPDRRPAKWQWLTPGSLLATLLWLAVSFGFTLYVAYISDYNATYGSLSAIVVFLMWLFLSAYAVLIGALLNAEIERQIHEDTTAGPARPPGQRGAMLADILDSSVPTVDALEKRQRRHASRHRHKADEDG